MAITRTEELAARLRLDILGGDLRPGARLKFPVLAERYGGSIGAIREALLELSHSGLVVSEPRLGFRVTPLTQRGLDELMQTRQELELIVLRRAIADGDLDWESRAIAAHHRFERTGHGTPGIHGSPSREWLDAHAAFHAAVLDGCSNRRLVAMVAALRDEIELYRRWASSDATAASDETASTEHRALLEAAIGRDPEAAEEQLRRLMAISAQLRIDEET
jgi:DNA-binding GntR family transcriptional regulator